MTSRTLFRRVFLLVVLSGGIGSAGGVFGAEIKVGGLFITIKNASPEVEAQAPEKTKTVPADLPRELAMRPLPTYRIQPPDIIQIEITTAKEGKSGGSQSSSNSDQGSASGGTGTVSGSDNQTKGGAITATINAGAVPSTDDTKKTEGSQTKTASGTLTVSGSGNVYGYSGTTTIVGNDNSMTKTGAGKVTFHMDEAATVNDGKRWGPANSNTLTITGDSISGGDANAGTLYVATNPSAVTFTGGGVLNLVAAGPADMPKVQKTVRKMSAANLVAGQYLVGPDGTINLRQYGTVQIMGMTIAEANAALEKHLSKYFDSVEVSVNVQGYNHQVYYIITDGAGSGDNVRRIPICGNETVLDAVAAVGGLSQFSSKKMWISRPSATNPEKGLLLPVDYDAIIRRGATATNYQIMPGDRFFIEGDKAIALNNSLSKRTAPVERMMGLIGLGVSVIRSIETILPKDSEGWKVEIGE